MFDFANSSYTTVIITVVFGDVFTRYIVGPDSPGGTEFRTGNLYWSIALMISYALCVISAPIFGAIMDYSASKKKFLFASYLLTIVATAALYVVKPGGYMLGIALLIISNFGFATGENFVASFLPDLGPQEDLGKISGFAWGLGYFGGLASTLIVTSLVNLDTFANIDITGPVTALFFLVAGIPTFLLLKEHGSAKPFPAGEKFIRFYLTNGFKRLAQTFHEIREFRDLMIFLVTVLFSWAGLTIVITFAFIYGKQIIHWDESVRSLMFIITQFTAAGGAIVFGFVQDKIGAKKTFNLTLVLWIISVIFIWGTKEITGFLNGVFGTSVHPQYFFLFVGCLAGMGLGSTQSASRAIVGIFSPESKSAEFFGFWGLAGKLAAIIGLFGVGIGQNILGLKTAILLCAVFFFLALVVNMFVDEERGKQAAIAHEGE